VHYKVVWSCLLLVEMTMTNLSAAGHFQSLATNAVTKVGELLRLFNTRATNLVLGAGAIHSAARLKSINAKHLSMVTQCLGMMTALLPHIRAALMAQLPSKQHTLLNDLDKIKKDYVDHSEKVLNKFVTIIGGIVEHGLAPRIANTDFDARAKELSSDSEEISCCIFLDGVSTNTQKMHQVLNAMLPPDHLQDVFSRIFAYVDQKVPTLLIAATSGSTSNGKATFRFPSSDDGKCRLIMEVETMTIKLNGLNGVLPWDFTCTNVLERKLDYTLKKDPTPTEDEPTPSVNDGQEDEDNVATDVNADEDNSSTAVDANGSSEIPEIANGDKQENSNEAEPIAEQAHGE
jgi:vacuolar protein sorting-associated protein 54